MKLKLGLRNKNVKTLHNALWQANVGMPSRPTAKHKNILKIDQIRTNKQIKNEHLRSTINYYVTLKT